MVQSIAENASRELGRRVARQIPDLPVDQIVAAVVAVMLRGGLEMPVAELETELLAELRSRVV